MKHPLPLHVLKVLIFLCLAVAFPAAGVGADAAPDRVYRITVDGTAYAVTTTLGQVTITSAGGGPTVTLTAGQISLSSVNGGAAASAASVMGDPALAKVVSQAAATALAAVIASVSIGPEPGAASALQGTLRVLMQSLPSKAAAAVVESAAKADPGNSPLLVTAAVKAAINTGMDPADAGRTMAAAVARGAMASPSTSKDLTDGLAIGIARSAVLAAVTPGLESTLAATIVSAISQGTTSGAIAGIVARESAAGGTVKVSTEAAEQIVKRVVSGAGSALVDIYPTTSALAAQQLGADAVKGAVLGAAEAAISTGVLVLPDRARVAAIEGKNDAFATLGLPVNSVVVPTLIPPGNNNTPFTPDDARRVSPSG